MEMGMSGKSAAHERRDPMNGSEEKGGGEPRHDDLLWKDLLTRFFVPMLQSLLPDLSRDIYSDRKSVV